MPEVPVNGERRARERIARIEQLLGELEQADELLPAEQARETVALVVELYGDGLQRVLSRVQDKQPQLIGELAEDELVSQLMLLHDLHPVALEQRVQGALEEVRPYLESHGGGVELVGISGTSVTLSLRGSCSGCPSSAMTLKLAVEDAIRKVAPEIEQIEAQGELEPESTPADGLLQLSVSGASVSGANGSEAKSADGLFQLSAAKAAGGVGAVSTARGDGAGETAWAQAGGLPQLNGGGKLVQRVAGEELLFVRLGEDLFAYRPRCAACGASLEEAGLEGELLSCAECEATYDVRHAGRGVGASDAQIEPIPLLVGPEGLVRVAVEAAA